MQIKVLSDKNALGLAAATLAASSLRSAIQKSGSARVVAATGASQFELLDELIKLPGIDWSAVELFHLDEYVELPITHPASFRRYLMERLIQKTGITRYHLLDPGTDAQAAADRFGLELSSKPVDILLAGIGENGHLAFNDPPADFQIEKPYLIVHLDDACRQQQVNEGWFANVADVPRRAISMSVRQILKANEIIVAVPDGRKAKAVKASIEGPLTNLMPASILRTHPNTILFLDKNSAALLSPEATR